MGLISFFFPERTPKSHVRTSFTESNLLPAHRRSHVRKTSSTQEKSLRRHSRRNTKPTSALSQSIHTNKTTQSGEPANLNGRSETQRPLSPSRSEQATSVSEAVAFQPTFERKGGPKRTQTLGRVTESFPIVLFEAASCLARSTRATIGFRGDIVRYTASVQNKEGFASFENAHAPRRGTKTSPEDATGSKKTKQGTSFRKCGKRRCGRV